MSLPDSFYIALCMTILLVGAVYWVWTQIQFLQRKVNVLENIVYELKTVCSSTNTSKIAGGDGPIMPTQYPPAPTSVLGDDEDLLHETLLRQEEEEPTPTLPPIVNASSPISMEVQEITDIPEDHSGSGIGDSGIGGNSGIGGSGNSGIIDIDLDHHQGFRHGHSLGQDLNDDQGLGLSHDQDHAQDLQPGGVGSGAVSMNSVSALESMSIKELRRLAQQKGVSGVADMKKKELIVAIRSIPIESFLE